MFVRWKKRPATKTRLRHVRRADGLWDVRRITTATGAVNSYAYLIQSVRTDGKPRQKTVAYLGCFSTICPDSWYRQSHFWKTAEDAIARLGLDPEVAASIRAELTKIVPVPFEESKRATLGELANIEASINRV